MTPEPTPGIDPGTEEAIQETFSAIAVGVTFFIVLLIAGVFMFGLLRSARYEKAVTLVISLSLLSLLAIGGAIATAGQNDSTVSTALIGLAGVGLGALAGAVTSVFTDKKHQGIGTDTDTDTPDFTGYSPPPPRPEPRGDDTPDEEGPTHRGT